MADQYIDATYVKSFLGTGLYNALDGVTGYSWTQQIEAATALIQSYMRNNGYSPGTTTTDETVKMAVMGALWQTCSGLPEKNIPLPDDWEANPLRVAYLGVLNGDATLASTPTTIQAVGGWGISTSTSGVTDSRTQYASRKQLTGY